MSDLQSMRLLSLWLGISLLIQTFEFFRIQKNMIGEGVWVWSELRKEVPQNMPVFNQFLDFIFQEKAHVIHLCARLLGGLCLVALGSNMELMVFLFLSHVCLLFRFRGAFNGGSDFLSLVVITGLLIAQVCNFLAR